jgi:hypothetical protein
MTFESFDLVLQRKQKRSQARKDKAAAAHAAGAAAERTTSEGVDNSQVDILSHSTQTACTISMTV